MLTTTNLTIERTVVPQMLGRAGAPGLRLQTMQLAILIHSSLTEHLHSHIPWAPLIVVTGVIPMTLQSTGPTETMKKMSSADVDDVKYGALLWHTYLKNQ